MYDFSTPEPTSYNSWIARSKIADCLRDLGMPDLAKDTMKATTSNDIVKQFLHIIKSKAKMLKRQDVLERLYFYGLVK